MEEDIRIEPDALEELRAKLERKYPHKEFTDAETMAIGQMWMGAGRAIYREIPRDDEDLPVIEG